MDNNIINILAGLSIVITYLGVCKIDRIMKKADIDSDIRGSVNMILVLIGMIVTLLSAYIIFW